MNIFYYFKSKNKTDEFPIPTIQAVNNDVDYISPLMDNESLDIQLAEISYIRFFSDSLGENATTPVSGTINFQGSPDGIYWQDFDISTINATDVYRSDIVMPYGYGDIKFIKIRFSSVSPLPMNFSCKIYRR